MRSESRWQFLIDFIRHDCWRKLVALCLALLLYWAIAPRTTEKQEKSFDIPVNIEMPANLTLCDNTPRKVKVTLSGRNKALEDIDPAALRIKAEVDRGRFIPGEQYPLRLHYEDVRGLPYGVRVSAVSPRELLLDLEPVITKRVPIRARFDSLGKLPDDYEISNVSFVPANVTLSGPARTLESIKEVFSMPIPLDEHVRFSFEHHCQLNTPPGIRSDRTEVAAHVEVVKALTTHTFRAVPLLIIQNAERTRKFQVTSLEPESVTVVANGPRGTLARMHSREFSASISLDKVDKPGTYNLPISANVSTPGGSVKIKNIHPTTARVTVLQE